MRHSPKQWMMRLSSAVALVAVLGLVVPALAQQRSRSGDRWEEQTAGGLAVPASTRLIRATDLMGMDVVNTRGEDLGTIDNIVLTRDLRSISYVVLSRGGVLGVGAENFAIPWQAVRLSRADNGDQQIVLSISSEQLEQAEGFSDDNWPEEGNLRWVSPADRRQSRQSWQDDSWQTDRSSRQTEGQWRTRGQDQTFGYDDQGWQRQGQQDWQRDQQRQQDQGWQRQGQQDWQRNQQRQQDQGWQRQGQQDWQRNQQRQQDQNWQRQGQQDWQRNQQRQQDQGWQRQGQQDWQSQGQLQPLDQSGQSRSQSQFQGRQQYQAREYPTGQRVSPRGRQPWQQEEQGFSDDEWFDQQYGNGSDRDRFGTQQQFEARRGDSDRQSVSAEEFWIRKGDELIGLDIQSSTDDQDLGEIEDLLIDPSSGQVAYGVVSFGGVLGIGQQVVAVPWNALDFQPADKLARLDATQDDLDSLAAGSIDELNVESTSYARRAAQVFGTQPVYGYQGERFEQDGQRQQRFQQDQDWQRQPRQQQQQQWDQDWQRQPRQQQQQWDQDWQRQPRQQQQWDQRSRDRQQDMLQSDVDIMENGRIVLPEQQGIERRDQWRRPQQDRQSQQDQRWQQQGQGQQDWQRQQQDRQSQQDQRWQQQGQGQQDWQRQQQDRQYQQGRSQQQSSWDIWGADSRFNRMYNPDRSTRIDGEVASVGTFRPDSGAQGLRLTVETQQGDNVIVLAGPKAFADQKGFRFRQGQQVQVSGSPAQISGRTVLMAREIELDGRSLTLRDEQGQPQWDIQSLQRQSQQQDRSQRQQSSQQRDRSQPQQ